MHIDNQPLPTDEQRQALCDLMYEAFVELRYLTGDQAHDLAYAFHNMPKTMFGWGHWSIEGTRAGRCTIKQSIKAIRVSTMSLHSMLFSSASSFVELLKEFIPTVYDRTAGANESMRVVLALIRVIRGLFVCSARVVLQAEKGDQGLNVEDPGLPWAEC